MNKSDEVVLILITNVEYSYLSLLFKQMMQLNHEDDETV